MTPVPKDALVFASSICCGTVPAKRGFGTDLCHGLVMQERFGDAVDSCQCAAALAPGEAGNVQNLGYSFSRLGKYREAIAAYQRAIDVAPDAPAPYAGIAAAYAQQRN